jgi:hypothetical protein
MVRIDRHNNFYSFDISSDNSIQLRWYFDLVAVVVTSLAVRMTALTISTPAMSVSY